MILLKNDGLIEIKLITTMGANVKTGESPIGFFGTGLKFAIATLLRNEIKFCLHIAACFLLYPHCLKAHRLL